MTAYHMANTSAWVLFLGALLALAQPTHAQDPFADAVASLTPGMHGGFGSQQLVLGPPHGTGLLQGSFDILALGSGGSIVLRFDLPVICDGPGADFTVFENVFHAGSERGPLFTEFGFVAVSQDGVNFIEFPFDATTHAGLAGRAPVLSNPENGIDPLDPSVSGGDAFDLAAVGLTWAAYVRITDVAGVIPDFGDMPQFSISPNAGFDLDAVAALHGCDPSSISSPTPTPSPTETPLPPDSTATPSATIPIVAPGDLDGDGQITDADTSLLIAEIFDGDGDRVPAGGGAVASGPEADVNGDDRITAADLVAQAVQRNP